MMLKVNRNQANCHAQGFDEFEYGVEFRDLLWFEDSGCLDGPLYIIGSKSEDNFLRVKNFYKELGRECYVVNGDRGMQDLTRKVTIEEGIALTTKEGVLHMAAKNGEVIIVDHGDSLAENQASHLRNFMLWKRDGIAKGFRLIFLYKDTPKNIQFDSHANIAKWF